MRSDIFQFNLPTHHVIHSTRTFVSMRLNFSIFEISHLFAFLSHGIVLDPIPQKRPDPMEGM